MAFSTTSPHRPLVSQSNHRLPIRSTAHRSVSLSAITDDSSSSSSGVVFQPIFDFQNPKTVDKFERIDDAIMGGISTSTVQSVQGNESAVAFASWSGVCRLDGGGFCGMRTLPFESALSIPSDTIGLYVDCRLTSDDEPHRRVWKISTRTEDSRGEQVYQAQYDLPVSNSTTANDWVRVKVPFSDFSLVRGPRMVQDGAPLNATSGLYQIGLTLSKFVMSTETTELPNFRPGYFELQLQAIGVYSNAPETTQVVHVTRSPETLSLSEANKKRPLAVNLLFPMAKLFFSEKSNRRKSAMRILRKERSLSHTRAMWHGIRYRARSVGIVRSLLQAASIVTVDCFRTVAKSVIRLGLVLPIRLVNRLLSLPSKLLATKQEKNVSL